MRDDEESVELEDVEVEHKTEMALLCIIEGQKHWIPFSQIVEDDSELGHWSKKGEVGLLVISEWLATEKGIV